MDQKQLQEQIALYYSKLPTDVQQSFSSMKWMETLKTVSTKYGLNENQKEILGTETTILLLGIITLEDYVTTLFNELGMVSTMIEKMVTEINDSVLKPILPSLAQAYDNHVESLVAEKYGGRENLDDRFKKLPKEVQQAITESNYQAALYAIASENKLSIDQMGALEEATNKVLLGMIHPEKYEAELKEKLNLSQEKITVLANAVNENVLKSIRAMLKLHWETGNEMGSGEDEVPIPPYAKSPIINTSTPTPKKEVVLVESSNSLSKTESGIYKNAGIEVMEEKKQESEENDLAKSIIASKLSTVTMTKPITSDHSLPKLSNQTPPQAPVKVKEAPAPLPAHDPYKESIE